MVHVAVPLTQRLDRIQDLIKTKTKEIVDLKKELASLIEEIEKHGIEISVGVSFDREEDSSLEDMFKIYAKAYPGMDIPLLSLEDFKSLMNEYIRN